MNCAIQWLLAAENSEIIQVCGH